MLRHVLTLGLIGSVLVGQLSACDVCLRAPGVPFVVDHPVAIEVAMATREAIDQGTIDLNPVLRKSLSVDRHLPLRLDRISPRQLVKFWLQTQPARHHASLRVTIDLVFVESNSVCHLDVREGQVLEDAGESGPAEIRLLTTKAGFYGLLLKGFERGEQLKLVAVESGTDDSPETLGQLFSALSSSEEPNSLVAL